MCWQIRISALCIYHSIAYHLSFFSNCWIIFFIIAESYKPEHQQIMILTPFSGYIPVSWSAGLSLINTGPYLLSMKTLHFSIMLYILHNVIMLFEVSITKLITSTHPYSLTVNILRPKQNCRNVTDDNFLCIYCIESIVFLYVFYWNMLRVVQLIISENCSVTIHHKIQWWFNLLTHICFTWLQRVDTHM